MKITLSIDDEVLAEARRRAAILGTTVDQLLRDYLKHFAGRTAPECDAGEFELLSRESRGDSRGWRFDRDEVHERR